MVFEFRKLKFLKLKWSIVEILRTGEVVENVGISCVLYWLLFGIENNFHATVSMPTTCC
jgi:hypothetical protein